MARNYFSSKNYLTLLYAYAVAAFALVGLPLLANAEPPERLLVHLLAYLEKDYAGAVSDRGDILSEGEYTEQVEFSGKVLLASGEVKALQEHPSILADVKTLAELVQSKGKPEQVAELAKKLQGAIIDATKIDVAPRAWPDLAHGQALYKQQCAICHGAKGGGDGPGGQSLDPQPANFLDSASMQNLSPLGAYNTIRIGVPGTGMPAFSDLTQEEAWNLAFFVLSWRYGKQDHGEALAAPDATNMLKLVATSSDAQLQNVLPGSPAEKSAQIARLRRHTAKDVAASVPLETAKQKLHAALEAFGRGDIDQAENLALHAYLDGIEPIEPRLRSTHPQEVAILESTMADVRRAIKQRGALADVGAATTVAIQKIEAAALLLDKDDLSPGVAFTAASTILLREGFEAVLLILALLGVIRVSDSRRAALWVHGGWITALLCGGVAWIFSGYVVEISGARRELVEAWTALLAVGVLLVVGFWLHSRTEIGRWNHFLKVKVRQALVEKNLFGLALISFIAVFREAFETVLFLRAIWLEGDAPARQAMTSGVVLTFALLIVGAWLMLKWSARLPIRKLFTLSALIMAALAFVFTGKGLHSLQEAGVLGTTTSHFSWHFDILGIYPTYETILPQLLILGIIVLLWQFGRQATVSRQTAA